MSKKNKENNEQANVQIEDNNNNNQKNNAPKGGGDSYFPGNEKVTKLAWTEARCLKHAKKYDSLTEWKKAISLVIKLQRATRLDQLLLLSHVRHFSTSD